MIGKFERLMCAALMLNFLNTAYLSWRYVALHAGWVTPGTGLCSWSRAIGCDRVLLTPQARAFYFPNAILGFGFSLGCLLWWYGGRRFGSQHRLHLIRALVFWLSVAAVATVYFFRLLVRLDAFCPFCPWHHLLVYVSLIGAVGIWRSTSKTPEPVSPRPLAPLVASCLLQFFLWPGIWAAAFAVGRVTP